MGQLFLKASVLIWLACQDYHKLAKRETAVNLATTPPLHKRHPLLQHWTNMKTWSDFALGVAVGLCVGPVVGLLFFLRQAAFAFKVKCFELASRLRKRHPIVRTGQQAVRRPSRYYVSE